MPNPNSYNCKRCLNFASKRHHLKLARFVNPLSFKKNYWTKERHQKRRKLSLYKNEAIVKHLLSPLHLFAWRYRMSVENAVCNKKTFQGANYVHVIQISTRISRSKRKQKQMSFQITAYSVILALSSQGIYKSGASWSNERNGCAYHLLSW